MPTTLPATGLPDNLVHPDPSEAVDLGRLRDRMNEIFRREGKALLIGPDADEEPTELPASAFEALKFVVEAMAQGQTIVLMPHGTELTTQEAADLLHVSRPHIIKLCDEGVLGHHRVGSHRRLRIEDVLEYRDRRGAERREHLRDLTQRSQEYEGQYR
jgi:excisionase family DNA binding protein